MQNTSLSTPSLEKLTLHGSVNSIFPQPQEESKIQKARRTLDEAANDVPDKDLQVFITELQYLIGSWFDYYEKQIFDGQTLRQILSGGQGYANRIWGKRN